MIVLPISAIYPFDGTHCWSPHDPGFVAVEDEPGSHLAGARHCADLIRAGRRIRPIAVWQMPDPPQAAGSPYYQRLDGFKRYWGYKIAGRIEIPCIVMDRHEPGCQHGLSMEIDEAEWANLAG